MASFACDVDSLYMVGLYDLFCQYDKMCSSKFFLKKTLTDLKIDWIWHLLINVLQILKPEVSQFATPPIQLSVPLYYILVLKNQNFRVFVPFTYCRSGRNLYRIMRRTVKVF